MTQTLKVLLLCSDQTATAVLKEILSKHVMLTLAGNFRELKGLLETGDYDVLLYSWCPHTESWNKAPDEVQQRCPDLPVIIVSSTTGEQEWVEALKAGAFDLLVPPYQERLVLSAIEHALASRDARALRNIAPRPKQKPD